MASSSEPPATEVRVTANPMQQVPKGRRASSFATATFSPGTGSSNRALHLGSNPAAQAAALAALHEGKEGDDDGTTAELQPGSSGKNLPIPFEAPQNQWFYVDAQGQRHTLVLTPTCVQTMSEFRGTKKRTQTTLNRLPAGNSSRAETAFLEDVKHVEASSVEPMRFDFHLRFFRTIANTRSARYLRANKTFFSFLSGTGLSLFLGVSAAEDKDDEAFKWAAGLAITATILNLILIAFAFNETRQIKKAAAKGAKKALALFLVCFVFGIGSLASCSNAVAIFNGLQNTEPTPTNECSYAAAQWWANFNCECFSVEEYCNPGSNNDNNDGATAGGSSSTPTTGGSLSGSGTGNTPGRRYLSNYETDATAADPAADYSSAHWGWSRALQGTGSETGDENPKDQFRKCPSGSATNLKEMTVASILGSGGSCDSDANPGTASCGLCNSAFVPSFRACVVMNFFVACLAVVAFPLRILHVAEDYTFSITTRKTVFLYFHTRDGRALQARMATARDALAAINCFHVLHAQMRERRLALARGGTAA